MGSLKTICKKQSLESIASTSNESNDIPSRNSSREEGNTTGDNTKRVKQLSERLRVMEEETELLKAVFWVAIEERSKLMAEVHEQVSNCLLLRDQETGQKFLDKVSTIKLLEEKRSGMLQLLHQDSNQLLVNSKYFCHSNNYHEVKLLADITDEGSEGCSQGFPIILSEPLNYQFSPTFLEGIPNYRRGKI